MSIRTYVVRRPDTEEYLVVKWTTDVEDATSWGTKAEAESYKTDDDDDVLEITELTEEEARITGRDLKRLREALGMSKVEFGVAIGYVGNDNTLTQTIRRIENGDREARPLAIEMAVLLSHQLPGDEGRMWRDQAGRTG